MTVTKIILAGLLTIGATVLSAQQKEINFTSLTTKDGLSSNTVNAIVKDRYGIIWFATDDGLDKFDGTHFTVYRHKAGDPASLGANEILSLHEDKSGNLWVGTSGGSLSLYDRKKDAFSAIPSGWAPNSITSNVIRAICSDYTGKLWVAHFDGVSIVDPATKKVSLIPAAQISGSTVNMPGICLFEDSRRYMWIGTNAGLFKFEPSTKSLIQFVHADNDTSSLDGNNVNAITEDKNGNIWIGTNNGLNRLSPGTNRFIRYNTGNRGAGVLNTAVSSIAADGQKLWIGTDDGLVIMNIQTGECTKFEQDQRNIRSLTAKWVRCIYIDKQGIYWLGTVRGGIDKYDKNLNLFNYVKSNVFDDKGLNASIVTSFAEAGKGSVFVGTDGGGLSLFDPATRSFQHIPVRSEKNNKGGQLTVLALAMTRKKQLLMGCFADGLFIVDPISKKYKQLTEGPGDDQIKSNDIYSITELHNGNILIGTNGEGINVLDSNYNLVERYTPHPKTARDIKLPINGYIRDIKEDKNNNIWIATHGGGIAILQPKTRVFSIYNSSNSQLPNDKVLTLLKDSHGQIWAGTFGGGLVLFNDSTSRFTVFSEKEGLQNAMVYKLVEDEMGLIWASTNNGLSSIDSKTKKINNYTYLNGLQRNNYVRGSGLRLSNGELFFGGLDGFNYFYPSYLINNTNIPAVLITGLRISNRPVTPSPDGPITEDISVAKEINLAYKQNFALDFVGLSYTTPEQNKYAYKLEGFDKDWTYAGNSTSASYTNLDPGDYTFHIRASNNNDVWNNEGTSIAVHVHPPFWRTIYAYVVYWLLLIGIGFYVRYKGIQKLKRKFALEQKKILEEQERREAERIHELDSLKIKFLTNLSHEFRTPISLILGPVDSLLEQQKDIHSFRQLDMIKRNARRLLNMVNQLLDFRKMEEQELKVHVTEGELVKFVREVSDSFIDLAERKKMDFAFNSKIDRLYVSFDHDKLERILFNILSNAFKFTHGGGKIRLLLDKAEKNDDPLKTWVAITISDTGVGIPEDKKEKIFNLFFQNATETSILNQGTGIGLTITKEFVEMHGGTISVESEPEKGTSFRVLLPFIPVPAPAKETTAVTGISAVEPTDESSEPITEETDTEKNQTDIPSILLVEDNDDFRDYLKDKLRLQHRVFEAVNGKEGWHKALAHHPQVIVSDISMPEMDGIDFCRKIKSDKRTSHIPVILLTALTGEEDQLKGLKTGASDYITKPFNADMLNAKINNLLVLNKTLKNTYTRQIKALAPDLVIHSADEELLQKIMRYLEENLANPQLSVEELSKHVGMSRSSLYSKLLELTGETPVEYIRSVKLDKAAILLAKSDMNIAQIAYSVGFSTSNYFAKSFKLKFNMLPSEYVSKMRNEGKKNNNGSAGRQI